MYQPAEDSYLILKHIKDYAKGTTLEIGTGSGILANEASKYSKTTATDIDTKSLNYCNSKYKNITFIKSNLFNNITEKYNLIIFNPPYLPLHPTEKSKELSSKNIIQDFLKQAKNHLKPKGKILLLFSSFSNINIKNFPNYKFKLIDKQHIFFEDLYLYLLTKTLNTK
ncbi:hypothetical protein CMI42_02315 [Candidatus Pacearchaeota archaeon]|nr:hypothetical protein [Candidatus Pacearchaeota archaeon]|tara:strand:+ start:125 stop:628 length:504 start_codon:yes stop_codon:yes gene_type:complete